MEPTMTPTDLFNALSAVADIAQIQYGNLADNSTWKVQYGPTITPDQITAAQAIIQQQTEGLIVVPTP